MTNLKMRRRRIPELTANNHMIGKIYSCFVDYYDIRLEATRRKQRPVLIVGGPRNNDYTVLPISTISRRENLDEEYDILIRPELRQQLKLPKECYIRTHKQTTIHRASFYALKGDLKKIDENMYLIALVKMERYQNYLMYQALF